MHVVRVSPSTLGVLLAALTSIANNPATPRALSSRLHRFLGMTRPGQSCQPNDVKVRVSVPFYADLRTDLAHAPKEAAFEVSIVNQYLAYFETLPDADGRAPKPKPQPPKLVEVSGTRLVELLDAVEELHGICANSDYTQASLVVMTGLIQALKAGIPKPVGHQLDVAKLTSLKDIIDRIPVDEDPYLKLSARVVWNNLVAILSTVEPESSET
jgi:hypothetical protein